jgi:hypothetical protein
VSHPGFDRGGGGLVVGGRLGAADGEKPEALQVRRLVTIFGLFL